MTLESFKSLILACCTADDDQSRLENESQYNSLIEEDAVSVIRLHLQNLIELPSETVQKISAVLLRRLLLVLRGRSPELFSPEFVDEMKNVLFGVFSNENYDKTIRVFVGDSLHFISLAAAANGIESDFFTPIFELCNSEIATISSTAIQCLASFIANKSVDVSELSEPINALVRADLSVQQPSEVFLAVFRLIYSASSVIDITPYIASICDTISTFQEPDINTLLRDLLSYKTIAITVFENSAEELVPRIIEIIKNTEGNMVTRGLAMQIFVSIVEVNPEKFVEQSEDIIGLFIDCLSEIDETYDPTVNVYIDLSIHSQAAVSIINLSMIYRGYYSFFEHVIDRFNALIEGGTFQSTVVAFDFMACISQEVTSYHGLYFPNDSMETFIAAFCSENETISYVSLRCFNKYLMAFSTQWRPNYELSTEGVIESLVEISQQKESQPLHELVIIAISMFIQLFPSTIPPSAETLVGYLFSMIDQENIDIICTIFNTLKVIVQILGHSYEPFAEQTLQVVNEIIGAGLEAYDEDVFFAATKLFVSFIYVLDREKTAEHSNEYLSLIEQIDVNGLSINAKTAIRDSLIDIQKVVPDAIAEHFDFFFQKSIEFISADFKAEHFEFSSNPTELFEYEIKSRVEDRVLVGYKKDDIANILVIFDIINILMETCKGQFFEHRVELLSKIIELQEKISSDKIKRYIVNFMFQLYQSFDPSFIGKLDEAMKLSGEDKGHIINIILICVQQSAIAYSSMTRFSDIIQATPYFARTVHFLVKSSFVTTVGIDEYFLQLLLMSIFKQMIDSSEREKAMFNRNSASFRIEFDLGLENSIQDPLMHCVRDLFKQNPEFTAQAITTECQMLKGRDRSVIIEYFPMEFIINEEKYHVNKTVFDIYGCLIAYAGRADLLVPLTSFMRETLALNSYDISHRIMSCVSYIIVRFDSQDIVAELLDIFFRALDIVRKSTQWEQTIYYTSKIILRYSEVIDVEACAHAFVEPLQQLQPSGNICRLPEKKKAIVLEAIPFIQSATSLTSNERNLINLLIEALQ
jgi:hypothetical protein